ncbi:MAG: PKD domain-containing protein, partial [Sphingobacteriales bacterium]
MKYFLSIVWAMCALLGFTTSAAAQGLSNSGTDFWVGYGHHQFMEPGQPNSQEMILYLSAEQTANVTVRIEGTAWVRNYTVPAGTVIASDLIPKTGANDARLISLPCSFVPPGTPCGGEGVFVNKGIHITSDAPIVAYAHIYGSASSGATMLMPVNTWGYSYMTLNSKQNYAANCFSWSYVIAQHDNTLIEVTPSQVTRFGRAAGTPYTIALNRGEIYQFMAGPESGTSKPELSGSKIRSIGNASGQCYPIAVFAGSSRTSNPIVCGSGGGDNDNQQIFPSQAWGKRYLTAPTSSSNNASTFMMNSYKIAVKDPATVVKRNGVQIPFGSLQSGSYYSFESSTADYIEADKPIMVAQFMTGGGCLNGGVGDPEMMYISPIEQGIKRIGFYRNNREAITTNYLTLIIPTAGVASLLIDGSGTFSHTYPHPNLPGYTVVVRRWSSAQAQATAQSDSAFTAITYGLGSVESYGYNAGTLINNLNVLPAIHNVNDTTVTVHDYTCTVTPVELGCNIAYKPTNLVWRLSTLGAILTPNADVIDNNPIPVDSSIIFGRWYYKFVCPGTYIFNDTGNYEIPVLSTHPTIENCTNTEEVRFNVRVKRSPLAEFSFAHTGCVADTIELTGVTTSAGYTINQWQWTFPTISETDTGLVSRQLFVVGSNIVNLRVISQEGCVRDTSGLVTIYDRPEAGFFSSALSGCAGTSIVFTDTSSYDGSATLNNVYWDFGDGTIINAASANPVNHTYTSYGTYTVRHAVGVSSSCVSDTISRQITIFATPTTSFTYPAGCLPATGVVQFNSTAIAPDGQAITSHLWNFGDPASGAANTSTLANPSHTYPGFGNYTISYRTETANGCFKDTTVNATFNLAPSFNYPALPSVCGNSAGTVSVATATVTNSVPGTGIYNGPGTSAAGIFDPVVAGAGIHTIWYVYTATSGCKDSVSQTITVAAAPDPTFSFTPAGCLPTSGQVSFTYTGTAQPGQTYLWNFGDPASGANNTSAVANPTHNFTPGTYTITLTVNNPATGCSNIQTITPTFNLTPQLTYPALAPTCENLSSVNIATATVTNGVTGTGVYSGPGTSPAGIFNPSIAGAGTHTITYTFTGPGNCVATITQTILVNAKPNASFTYPTAACLPATGIANFTYNGSLSAGQTYAWNFGDPASGANNTSAVQNPSHVYTNTGTYTVTVTVTNTNGCVDDSVINNIVFSVSPALAYPALTAVCSNDASLSVATATVTNGVSGTGVYSGPGTDAAGNFNPAIAGPGSHTITYTFTSSANCVASITRTIQVNPAPSAAFTTSTTACLPANGNVAFTYTGTVQAGQTYAWNFGDPASGANNTSALQNPTHNFAEGNYMIILTVTNPATGCIDKDTLTQTFALTPALAYPALASTCENLTSVNIATASVTNGVTGTGVYSGPGTSAAGIFNPAIAGAGTHTITYTFTSAANCVATITQTIVVNAKPNASFTYPTAACLPSTGIANFTYNGSMSPGQTYSWNFGDPASGANNTSTAQNPAHTYTNTGTYSVSVTVTNANGCIDDSVINNIVFSVTPVVTYPALTAVCENLSSINVATASVTNGVNGTGVYSGPGTSAAGIFNPSVAGPGTHTITYTFTSSGNCVATTTQIITVNPKPVSAFTITPNICLGQQANITPNATIPSGSITSWKWFFGDGNTATYTNGNTFNYLYTAFGTYTVKLVTVSANGCESDTARQTITVGTVPVASFTMPSSVCMPDGVTFTNNSSVTDGSTLTYVWNFGDPASGANNTSTQTSPTHIYATTGSYTITLRATGGNGCFKDSVQVFNQFFNKPIAQFSVTPTALCQGADNVFTDQSSAPNSTISSRLWIFGDGTTSTAANPT